MHYKTLVWNSTHTNDYLGNNFAILRNQKDARTSFNGKILKFVLFCSAKFRVVKVLLT